MYTKKLSTSSERWFPFLLLGSTFLILFCSQVVEKSMFIDGVWYAGIARNLSQGQGGFWFPQFSETIFHNFHEHPPLVFGLQSFLFSIFGDFFWVERLFSLLQYLGIAAGILKIWLLLFPADHPNRKLWFVPVVLWQLNLVNYYYLPANVLDTSLCLFDLWAIYFFLKGIHESRFYLIAGGLLILAALFSKGFVGLFPLAFFGVYALTGREVSYRKAGQLTLLLTCGIILALLCLFVLYSPAWHSLSNYLEVQVLASLKGERRLYHFREDRFFILRQLFFVLLPMFFFLIGSWMMSRFSNKATSIPNIPSPPKFLFFLVGLSASLPLMISPRQALLYLMPSLPFFSLSIAIGAAPFVLHLMERAFFKTRLRPLLNIALFVAGIAGLLLCRQNYKKVNQRDLSVIEDTDLIGQMVGKQATVASDVYNMYISGYLMRYYQVSLDTSGIQHDYLISTKEHPSPLPFYTPVDLPTHHYLLYRKNSPNQMSRNYE